MPGAGLSHERKPWPTGWNRALEPYAAGCVGGQWAAWGVSSRQRTGLTLRCGVFSGADIPLR